MKILITGSSGLIGGACVEYFDQQGHTIIGVDNNTREQLFGAEGRVWWNLHRIYHYTKNYTPINADITDHEAMRQIFVKNGPFDAIIHCAAQPSHDKSAEIPYQDFKINAFATVNLLELTRLLSPQADFVFMSTNKVYGNRPNLVFKKELETRYDYNIPDGSDGNFGFLSFVGAKNVQGINEEMSIDQCIHSPFGVSKAAADLMVQEYGYYFGLKTTVLRAGCLTGPGHSGVQLHGFLSYLLKCAINGTPYTIFGYKGKQVRDNLHSRDVARIIEAIITKPIKPKGMVYNIGGGRENSCSVLEAITMIEKITGRKINHTYVDTPRVGDHICYITDMSAFYHDYPNFKLEKTLQDTLEDMAHVDFWGKYCDHEDTRNWPLNENSVVWDVGGFRGAWTLSIVDKYNPYVHIFEPIREFYDACVYRFRDNPKVKVHHYGIDDIERTEVAQRQGQNSSIHRGAQGQQPMPDDKVHGAPIKERILLRNVSQVLHELGGYVDLVSFNCEGGEYRTLEKLTQSGEIAKFQNVQIQFHNFWKAASAWRDTIRQNLSKTHTEKYNYPWTWEGWTLK